MSRTLHIITGGALYVATGTRCLREVLCLTIRAVHHLHLHPTALLVVVVRRWPFVAFAALLTRVPLLVVMYAINMLLEKLLVAERFLT